MPPQKATEALDIGKDLAGCFPFSLKKLERFLLASFFDDNPLKPRSRVGTRRVISLLKLKEQRGVIGKDSISDGMVGHLLGHPRRELGIQLDDRVSVPTDFLALNTRWNEGTRVPNVRGWPRNAHGVKRAGVAPELPSGLGT